MFIDKVEIYVKAGNGGNGAVAFHREKYVAEGGPSGGDGGHGGNVVFEVDEGENTLLPFRYRRKFVAQNGEDGKGEKFHGKTAEDLIIKVPQGTLIKDAESGRLMYDMGEDGRFIAAKGGRGGFGNTHFATPTRQIPRFAKSGTTGEERTLVLELKMLADVGLVGFPNVGKSTLLSMVSAARPKIANYHFTTLSPMLGVVKVDTSSFVMADIPGLIEGASEGAGLGHEFLRHVDRCRLLLHVVDAASTEGRDPIDDIEKINAELKNYNEEMANRPQILVANKCDVGIEEETKKRLEEYAKTHDMPIFYISAATRSGVNELLFETVKLLSTLPEQKRFEADFVEEVVEESDDKSVTATLRKGGVWVVEAEWLERLVGNVNFEDRESLAYFHKVLKKAKVFEQLEELGVQDGDSVSIYGFEFDYVK
ncbi:MAG: GTPase ObgE [Clostridia bacterium]|nr:GTPase ObgE [Clostridia bacterium]